MACPNFDRVRSTDQVADYSCSCDAGWTGKNCDQGVSIEEDKWKEHADYVVADVLECASNPCLNGAVCNEGANGYTCTCATGFTGTNCETNIDDCAAAPCVNGVW